MKGRGTATNLYKGFQMTLVTFSLLWYLYRMKKHSKYISSKCALEFSSAFVKFFSKPCLNMVALTENACTGALQWQTIQILPTHLFYQPFPATLPECEVAPPTNNPQTCNTVNLYKFKFTCDSGQVFFLAPPINNVRYFFIGFVWIEQVTVQTICTVLTQVAPPQFTLNVNSLAWHNVAICMFPTIYYQMAPYFNNFFF